MALSRWYLTAPVPPSGQPHYVNGVARLDRRAVEPDAVLLAALQADRGGGTGACGASANAARTLDLDIIAMGDG